MIVQMMLIAIYCFSISLLSLAIGLGGIISLVDNQVLGAVVMLAGQVALKNGLGAIGIALLRVQRGARHVRNHGVAAAKGVLGSSQGVVTGSGLGEPDITTIAGEVAGLESRGHVFLDDDGATGRVDEVRTCAWVRTSARAIHVCFVDKTYPSSSWQ